VSQSSQLRIVAPPGVFRPRSDTWMLAEIIGKEVLPGSSVLDLCTGSGALAIAAAKAGADEVTAVDVSRRSVLAARLNAALNGARVRAVRGDLFDAVAGRRFDLIVSNPPYLPSAGAIPGHGPARAWEGGDGGRVFIDRILAAAADHLEPGGRLLMIHSSVCGTAETLARLRETGMKASVIARHRGPVGPLLAARAPELEEEELVVISGSPERGVGL
jgi:release factor glutamine methyltransferase